jgi:hypothetical protein
MKFLKHFGLIVISLIGIITGGCLLGVMIEIPFFTKAPVWLRIGDGFMILCLLLASYDGN